MFVNETAIPAHKLYDLSDYSGLAAVVFPYNFLLTYRLSTNKE